MFVELNVWQPGHENIMQLHLYAILLLTMSREAGVPIDPHDVELVLFANNSVQKKSEIWRMNYNPETFLGRDWAPNRWYGLLETDSLQFLNEPAHRGLSNGLPVEVNKDPPAPKACHFCGSLRDLGETRSAPILTLCRSCFDKRRCACRRLLRVPGRKYCGPDCSQLKSGTVLILPTAKNGTT